MIVDRCCRCCVYSVFNMWKVQFDHPCVRSHLSMRQSGPDSTRLSLPVHARGHNTNNFTHKKTPHFLISSLKTQFSRALSDDREPISARTSLSSRPHDRCLPSVRHLWLFLPPLCLLAKRWFAPLVEHMCGLCCRSQSVYLDPGPCLHRECASSSLAKKRYKVTLE